METKKLNKLSLKDFIKDTSPRARLQSIRLPRDLSLGGTKLSKKLYKPNLNVVRNKDKPKVTIKRNDNSKEKHEKSREKQKPRFIQPTGVFSEGVGDTIRPQEDRVSVSTHKKPPSLKKEPKVVEKQPEHNVLEEIMKYQEDSHSDTDEKVPFKPIDWCTSKLTGDAVKDEVKSEVLDSFGVLPKAYVDSFGRTSSNISLTLWQLPDSLAFKTKTEDPKNRKLIDCKLSDLPEGQIGKMCIRESGRVIVYIGNIKYELEPVHFENFVEELVTLDIKAGQKSTATVLGNIDDRFLLTPLWHSLLQ